ncbi:hypothetical protein [Corynebacterium sp. MC3]|uniref:hypothetical protein n=1 Tax=Corynebacterium sp. MC3 TaxID=1720193 RepID=UPI0008D915E5|nr:hypothetical protein [Corynebacterium sp. MC3]
MIDYATRDDAVLREIVMPLGDAASEYDVDAIADRTIIQVMVGPHPRYMMGVNEAEFWDIVEANALDTDPETVDAPLPPAPARVIVFMDVNHEVVRDRGAVSVVYLTVCDHETYDVHGEAAVEPSNDAEPYLEAVHGLLAERFTGVENVAITFTTLS